MKPNTQLEQSALTTFIPDEKIFFGVGISTYDGVWEVNKNKKGEYACRQALPDVPNAEGDCEEMKSLLDRYDFNLQPENPRKRDALLKCDPN